jgi:hypothetical protein
MAVFSRRAVLQWEGEVPAGSGEVAAGSGAFTVGAIFPSIAGDPAGKTTPEELLAASHATCYGIGLRSLIARRGGDRGEGTAGDPPPILPSHGDRRRTGRHRRITAAAARAGDGREVHDFHCHSRRRRGLIRGANRALRNRA